MRAETLAEAEVVGFLNQHFTLAWENLYPELFGRADPNAAPPRYVLYVECAGTPDSIALDAALAATNPLYGTYRHGGRRLGPLLVRRLPPGTFDALARWRLERAP